MKIIYDINDFVGLFMCFATFAIIGQIINAVWMPVIVLESFNETLFIAIMLGFSVWSGRRMGYIYDQEKMSENDEKQTKKGGGD